MKLLPVIVPIKIMFSPIIPICLIGIITKYAAFVNMSTPLFFCENLHEWPLSRNIML